MFSDHQQPIEEKMFHNTEEAVRAYEKQAEQQRFAAQVKSQSCGLGHAEPGRLTGEARQPIDRTVEALIRLMNACHDEMSNLSGQLAPITQSIPGADSSEKLPPASCRLEEKLIEVAAGLHALQSRLRNQRESLCI